MKLLDSIRFRLAGLFHSSEMNRDMEDELRSHIQHRADDLERSGLPRAEALHRANIEFGGRARVREECREAVGGTFLETILQDLRFGARVLKKSRGFAVVAVLTLAIAIGANAVVFGIINALLLRPMDLPKVQTLYGIQRKASFVDPTESYPDYLDLRQRNHTFEDLITYNIPQAGLDTGESVSTPWFYEVSGNYFDALGIQPYMGRLFHSSDEHGPNSAPYIVLTYGYWHSQFHDDRGVIGRTVQLNRHPFTIIGVTPPGFSGTLLFIPQSFFVSLINQEQVEGASALDARSNREFLMVLGHLKPGVTPAQAIDDLNSVGAELAEDYPKDDAPVKYSLTRPSLPGDFMAQPLRAFMAALMLLAALILLAACANLGSLFAARAADRSREIALRLSLGASRLRILRQLLTEAMLISLAGGGLGLWCSVMLLQWLSTWQPIPGIPISIPVHPDVHVYAVAVVLALLSGFLFGLAPVSQVFPANPYEVVKSGSVAKAGRRITFREALLAIQIAICALLLTSSLVAVRGMAHSLHSDFGFEPRDASLVQTYWTMAGYRNDQIAAMQDRLHDSLATIPGVESVGMMDNPPLYYGWNAALVFSDQTIDLKAANAAANSASYIVSPDYFTAARTKLLAGRLFSEEDDAKSPRVAVVNREFARKLFGSVPNALGGHFKTQDGTRVQVVGVVENGKYVSLTEDPQVAVFHPLKQTPTYGVWFVVRSKSNPLQLAADVQGKIRALDPALPFSIQTWFDELNGAALFPPRVATIALGVLGVMGAILSITGIFGLAAYSVSKRKRELGIRIALGAQRNELLQAALGRAFKLLAVGSAAGLLLGILASRVLASIVYQATPRDPVVLAGVVFGMMLLGLAATWIPARRALSLDPLMLLREE